MSCNFCSDPGNHIAGHSMNLTDMVGHARHNLKIVPFGDDDAFLAGISIQCVDCNKRLMEITNKVNFCPMCGDKIKQMNADHLGDCVCYSCDKKLTCPHCSITGSKLKFRQTTGYYDQEEVFVCPDPCGRSFKEGRAVPPRLLNCKGCNKSITRMFAKTNGGFCYACEMNGS